jgi:CRISPR-associated protein Csb1
LDETEDKDALKAYSERGFRHVPASATHGGVIAKGDIRREVTLQVAALRLLRGTTDDETKKLRAYLLGLALVAFTKPAVGFLRQGCNVVMDGDKKPESNVVFPDGRREVSGLTHPAALAFARQAAKVFGVGESKTVKFDTLLAKEETTGEGKKGKKGKKTEKAKGE